MNCIPMNGTQITLEIKKKNEWHSRLHQSLKMNGTPMNGTQITLEIEKTNEWHLDYIRDQLD